MFLSEHQKLLDLDTCSNRTRYKRDFVYIQAQKYARHVLSVHQMFTLHEVKGQRLTIHSPSLHAKVVENSGQLITEMSKLLIIVVK